MEAPLLASPRDEPGDGADGADGAGKPVAATASDAANHDVEVTPFRAVRYALSLALLAFSIVLVVALIFTDNTRVAREANAWVALAVVVSDGRTTRLGTRWHRCFWTRLTAGRRAALPSSQVVAVSWLSMIEGQQAALVGLPPVEPALYNESHPLTHKNTALAFAGDNRNRYLTGRQFLVLLVVFAIGQAAGPLDPNGDVLGMPDGVKFVFLDIGLGMVMFTSILGQLGTQVRREGGGSEAAGGALRTFASRLASHEPDPKGGEGWGAANT